MTDKSHLLITHPVPGLCVIQFNAPARKNALNRATYVGLTDAIEEANAADDVEVIALTGVGEYFSSGNDMANASLNTDLKEYLDDAIVRVRRLVQAFVRCEKLLVAVVNGPAIGLAATIVPLCDVAYASDTAYFLTPFSRLGLSAEGGSSFTFPRVLGPSKAAEMLLLNHRMDAAEALRTGFVSEVFSVAALRTELWPRIERLPALAQGSVRGGKRLIRNIDRPALLAAVEDELTLLRERMQSDEAANAIISFTTRKSKL